MFFHIFLMFILWEQGISNCLVLLGWWSDLNSVVAAHCPEVGDFKSRSTVGLAAEF
jgi:hypothetical protein